MVEKWIIRSFYAKDFYGLNWGPPNSLGAFISSSFLQIINACAKKK